MPEAVPASPPVPPSTRRVWFALGPVMVTTGRLVGAAVVLAVIAALAIGWRRIDLEAVHIRAQELPGWAVFAVICLLPLAGVPAAILHVVSGVRFGMPAGFAVVVLATVFHHIMGYSLVRLAPRVFARRLAAWREHFPRGAHRPMTVFSCLLPGMPYSVQLYLLPLLGVPLQVLLTVSVPLHALRALVSILGGAWSAELTPPKLAALAIYYLVLTAVCTLMIRRIRAELRRKRGTQRPVG